jgi:hypothetical protein
MRMIMKRIVMICILMFILACIFLPFSEAETFQVGEKTSESDLDHWGDFKYHYFDSESVLWGYEKYLDYFPSIFDGNESTGLKKYFGKDSGSLNVWVLFPDPIFINNITVKPSFGGNKSKYSISINYQDSGITLNWKSDEEKTFKINTLIDTLHLSIFEENFIGGNGNGTGYYIFNEVIINFTPSIDNSADIQKQINLLNQNLNKVINDIVVVKKDIKNLKENITNIKNTIPSEYNDSVIKDQIKNLTQEINSLKENLSKFNNSKPMAYNDSTLKSGISGLENKNLFLKQQINNLTIKINNLTSELKKLSEEVKNLEGTSTGGIEAKSDELSYLQNSGFVILIVIIIVLLLVIFKLSIIISKKQHSASETKMTENGVYSKVMQNLMFDYEPDRVKLSDDELRLALDKKYRSGEMSSETRKDIKNIISTQRNQENGKNG